jgi:hypothetical protein
MVSQKDGLPLLLQVENLFSDTGGGEHLGEVSGINLSVTNRG